jgi:hypothetical protein
MSYKNLNINQKINAKGNELIMFGRPTTGVMKMVKKGYIISCGDKLKLRDESENNNRNYDGPGDDYYSGYYGGDWGTYADDHRMIEAQKLK